jgi:hypothetical protein
MSTFETYVGFRGVRDSKITLDEFEDYYTFVSASIDRDDYFELMMNNAWRMNEGANRNWEAKGWTNESNPKSKDETLQSRAKEQANRSLLANNKRIED